MLVLCPAPHGLVIAVHPERYDHRVTGDAMELFQQLQALFRFAQMVDETDAEDVVDEVVRHRQFEGRCLKTVNPLCDVPGPVGHAGIDHGLIVVAGVNDALRIFGQHIPEAAGAARGIQHRLRITGET